MYSLPWRNIVKQFAPLLSLPCVLVCSMALAQIEEIVITAEKREAFIQDTPIAISAFDQSKLEAASIDDALDIQFSVPNMLYTKANFTGSDMSIRGIGNSAVGVSADSGAGIHINGVYVNAPRIFETEFFDMERVEILRGPQGTLYGRNTTAGVLNIISAKPTEEFGAKVSVTGGNYDTIKLKGMVNIPLTDTIQQRFAVFSLDRDGYVKNIYTGNDIDDRDMYSVRSTTAFQFSDSVDGTLVLSKFREDDSRMRVSKQLCIKDPDGVLGCLPTGLDTQVWNGNAGISGRLGQAIGISAPGQDQYADSVNPSDLRKVNADFDPLYFVEEAFASFELNVDLGDVLFTSLTGYHNAYANGRTDFDWTVPSANFLAPVVDYFDGVRTYTTNFDTPVDSSSNDSEQFSQEFRLTSELPGSFNYTLGLFAMKYESDNHYTVYFPVGHFYGNLFGLSVAESRYDNHSKHYAIETWALFGEGYFKLDDDSKITAGLRYTDEYKESAFKTLYLNLATSIDAPFFEQDNDWQEWTGKLGYDRNIEYSSGGEGLLFVTLSRGYKGGGFNPASSTGAFDDTFDPEYVNALEVGVKNTLLNNSLQANLSAFYYDYEGLQVSKIIDQSSINENVDATIMGLEGEFIYAPNEHWLMGLNLAYLDSEIGDFQTFDPTDPAQTGSAAGVVTDGNNNCLPPFVSTPDGPTCTGANPGVDVDLQGNRLPNSPEFSTNASIEYIADLGNGYSLSSRLQYYWQDEYYSRIFNTAKDKIESWSVIDAQMTLRSPAEKWSLQAWVKNIKDDDYITGHYTTDASAGLFTNVFLLEPRTFGLTLDYQF